MLEWGEGRHPIDQALTILSAASPEENWDRLADLSIGQRDARLLRVREHTLGPLLEGFAECPNCQERLEFSMRVADLLAAELDTKLPGEHTLNAADYEVRFRLPNSRDLAAVLGEVDLVNARRQLLGRCILEVRHGDDEVGWETLGEAEITALGEETAALDPLSEIQLDLDCPACQHRWSVIFDITTFFWREIRNYGRRLLREVNLLARAYGWREADILALSAYRRRQYLEMVI